MRQYLLYITLPFFIWLGIKRPLAAIILYVAINIVRPEMFFWGGRTGTFIFKVFFVLFVLSFLLNAKEKLLTPIRNKELFYILWLYIALLVSIYLSHYPLPYRAYYFANEIIKIYVFCWVLIAVLDNVDKIIIFEHWVLGLGAFLALWGVDQHNRGNYRIEGMSGLDSNEFAALMVLLSPLAFNLLLNGKKSSHKFFGFFASSAFVLSIIFSSSRGGMLGLSLVALFYLMRSTHKVKIILVLIVVALLGSSFLPQDISNRFSTIFADDEERDNSAGSRLVLWQAGLMVFRDNPLFGTGFHTFPEAKLPYKHQVAGVSEELLDFSFLPYKVAHNTYVEILSESGLFAFIPYMLLLVTNFLKNRNVRKKYIDCSNKESTLNLLLSMDIGITGCAFCFVFINSVTSVIFPVQIIVCSCLRTALLMEDD